MLITKEQQEALVEKYIRDNHNTDECIGFIDGMNAAIKLISRLETTNTEPKENAFGVYPDSVKMGLSGKNKLMAIFKLEKQAENFGRFMWGSYYLIKPIYSHDMIPTLAVYREYFDNKYPCTDESNDGSDMSLEDYVRYATYNYLLNVYEKGVRT